MKTNSKILACLMLFIQISGLKAQFSGAFAPSNWGTVAVNSDGITNASGAPNSIYMVSGDNQSGNFGTNDYTITITQPGFITFNWNYTTVDGAQYDYPQVVVNNIASLVTGYSTTGGTAQSGTQTCISVTTGDVFRFRMYTVDNAVGAATCTFSNFYFATGNVTITPASPTVCPGNTLALTASGGTNYVWSGGITNGVPFTPTASSVYTVSSGTGGCITSKTVAVVYNPPLSISGPTSNICANSSATLIGAGGTTYTWNTGAVSPSIVITPSVNTSYTISGVSSQGCNTQGVKTITVDPGLPPVTASASSPGSGVCPGKTLTLNGGGATTYTWTGGSPTVTNGVAFAPSTTTSYTVTGGNSCGTATAAITVSIHPLPVVNAVASSASLCSGSSLTLTGVGNATNYAWSGGPIPITNGGGFTPLTTITYTLIGTSALTCTASTTTVVTVVNTPNVFPTSNPPLICVGGTSTLTATGATNYTWTSASQTINTANFVVSPTVGITTYTVTKANSNCVDTKTINVTTNALPNIFAIVTPTVVCALTPATLAVGGAQTYTWTAPGPPSYTFTGASPVTSPVAPSIYSVAASDGTCINTTTVFLNANPNPTIVASASSPTTCGGEAITLSATGGINYTWTSTGTVTSSAQSFTDAPTIPTAYNVTGNNSFGCTSGANQVVLVLPSPTLVASSSAPLVCNNSSVILTASGAGTYTWSPNAGGVNTNTALVNPTNTTSGPVVFTVQGTSSLNACQSTKTVLVNIFIPTLTVGGNTNTCAEGSVTLTILGGNSNYNWNTGSTNVLSQNITASLTASAVFTLSANTLSTGVTCPSTNTVEIGIYYNPTITAVADRTTICRDESVDIVAGGGIAYTWNTGSTNTVLTVSPVGNIINYTVIGTDANGCSSTASVQIKISGCVGMPELNATNGLNIYPNPNNGLFNIEANTAIKLNLVNELGQLVRVIVLSDANNYKISVTDLAKGIYFIYGQKDSIQIYQKIVVTK